MFRSIRVQLLKMPVCSVSVGRSIDPYLYDGRKFHLRALLLCVGDLNLRLKLRMPAQVMKCHFWHGALCASIPPILLPSPSRGQPMCTPMFGC